MEMPENPFTIENLTWAAKECLKGVQWKNSVARWRMNLIGNCMRLEKELRNGTYRMTEPTRFTITRPKPRIVSSMKFRDRVVHKVICHQGHLIEDLFRDAFFDNTACQKGKGTDFARERFKKHLMHHYAKYGNEGYVLNLDVRHFFQSISHDRLIEFVYRKVRNPQVRHLVADIVRKSGADGIGLDLGSEISQSLANAYLTAVDFVVKMRCGVKGYVRYADNMVCLIPPDAMSPYPDDYSGVHGYARFVLEQIRYAMGTLGLELNPKSALFPLRQGVCFLGFRWKIGAQGKILTKVLPKNARKAKRHILHLAKKVQRGELPKTALIEAFRAWAAHADKATVMRGSLIHRIQMVMEKNK